MASQIDDTPSSSTLFISTDKEHYIAGECVKGTVYLRESNDEGLQSKGIRLWFKGREITKVERRIDKITARCENDIAEKIILKAKFNLAKFSGGRLNPGYYEYPFEAPLPPGLPSTMHARMHSSSDGSYCEVVYEMEASVKGTDIKSSTIINISSRPKPIDYLEGSVMSPPSSQRVTCLLCCDGGTITMSSEGTKGVLYHGDIIEVGWVFRRDRSPLAALLFSSFSATSVEVTLEEQVRWSVGFQVSKKWSQTLSRVLDRRVILASAMDDNSGKTDSPLAEKTRLLRSCPYVQLTVPRVARNTYKGRLVTVDHYLTVKVLTKSWYTTSPSNRLALYVQPLDKPLALSPNPDRLRYDPPVNHALPPPYWENPVVAPIAQFPTSNLVMRDELGPDTSNAPLLETMKHGLKLSFDPLTYTNQLLTQPTASETIQNLTPSEYANLLRQVDNPYDQPIIAKCLAEVMGKKRFTCAHLARACEYDGVLDWNRVAMVKAMAPLVGDWEDGKMLLWEVLDGFERVRCWDVLGSHELV